jgi:hypothetical protein
VWKVEQRGKLYRVVNGDRVWGANKGCTEEEAHAVANGLNVMEYAKAATADDLNTLEDQSASALRNIYLNAMEEDFTPLQEAGFQTIRNKHAKRRNPYGEIDMLTGESLDPPVRLVDPSELVPVKGIRSTDKGCPLPPNDWWCSREPGHEGPCAAYPKQSAFIGTITISDRCEHGHVICFKCDP